MVIIVNHIHTRALCASLQSAAVQAHYTRARFVHTRPDVSVWPTNKESSSVRQFFSVIHVQAHVYNVMTAENVDLMNIN